MSTRLFLVISPFQLLCAIEARSTLPADAKTILVVIHRDTSDHPAHQQMITLIDGHWETVLHFRETRRRGLLRALNRLWLTARLRRTLRQAQPPIGPVYIGEPRNTWLNWIGQTFGSERIWLDDGAASLILLHRLQTGDLPDPPTQFFTIFGDTAAHTPTGTTIRHNPLAHVRKDVAAPKSQHGALFAGQSLTETGLLSEQDELDGIAQVLRLYGPLTYAPHRHDSAAKLNKIRDLGIPIDTFDGPLEIALPARNIHPKYLVSWYSTVLFTVPRLCPHITPISLRHDTLFDGAADSDLAIVYAALKRQDTQIHQIAVKSETGP